MHAFFVTIFSAVLMILSFVVFSSSRDLDEFALDKQTKVKFSTSSSIVRHCEGVTPNKECITTEQSIFTNPDVLLLGNSQLHAVNQPNLGENVVGDFISNLEKNGQKYLIVSLPNGNLCEFTNQAEIFAKNTEDLTVLLSAVFDDTRTSNLRQSLKSNLQPNNEQLLLREKVEQILRVNLQRYFYFDDIFENMRGKILISLYRLRNFIFGINASTVRPKNNYAYYKNLECMNQFISNYPRIRLQIFIAPIRNDAKLPYNQSDYARFKLDVLALTENSQNASFRDFEKIVPNRFWGTKESTNISGQPEIDFMHFQSFGHRILANKLLEIVN